MYAIAMDDGMTVTQFGEAMRNRRQAISLCATLNNLFSSNGVYYSIVRI